MGQGHQLVSLLQGIRHGPADLNLGDDRLASEGNCRFCKMLKTMIYKQFSWIQKGQIPAPQGVSVFVSCQRR